MIGISSNDAGGAEILSEYVINNKNKYLFFLSGPAVKIFRKKISNLKISTFNKSIHKLSLVISSTGWATKNEINIIHQCKVNNIKVCAFLDHWINYKKRFLRRNRLVLPDEIWVGDSLAYKLAKETFNGDIKILRKKNYYFEKVKKFFNIKKKQKKNIKKKVLYLCEPITELKKKNFYSEKQCINLFLKKITKIYKLNKIIFRPHPYENPKKYNWLNKFKEYKISIRKDNDLLDEIYKNDIIVGCNTVAMYVAILANKKVYSSIPKGFLCEIPSSRIHYLNKF